MTSDEIGAIPIDAPSSFDPGQLILGQRPFSSMSDDELIAGIRQLREVREPLLAGSTRRNLGVTRTSKPKAPKARAKPGGVDAFAADLLTSLFSEGEDEK